MAQLTFSDFEKDLQRKKSRKAEFLELLDRLVPWAGLPHLKMSLTLVKGFDSR